MLLFVFPCIPLPHPSSASFSSLSHFTSIIFLLLLHLHPPLSSSSYLTFHLCSLPYHPSPFAPSPSIITYPHMSPFFFYYITHIYSPSVLPASPHLPHGSFLTLSLISLFIIYHIYYYYYYYLSLYHT